MRVSARGGEWLLADTWSLLTLTPARSQGERGHCPHHAERSDAQVSEREETKRMRLFVEASLDDAAVTAIWNAATLLRADPSVPDSAIRWVGRDAIHLTLRFLGEVADDRLDDLSGAIVGLAGGGPIDLRLTEVGSFGGRRPRAIWIGLAHDDGFELLQGLRRRLDESLAVVGFEPEPGSYRPHVTIGRVRRQATKRDQAAMWGTIRTAVAAAPALAVKATVARVALVESRLLTEGPRYHRRATTEL